MTTNSNRGESDDSAHTTGEDVKNTTNTETDSSEDEDVAAEDTETSSLTSSDEFENRIDEIVEEEDGSISVTNLSHRLAHEFDPEPEDVEDALTTVASINDDGDVTGVATGVGRAMDSQGLTWDTVESAFKCDPGEVGEPDVTTQSDVKDWAREKCVEFMNDSYDWMYLDDEEHGVSEFLWYDQEKGIYVKEAKDRIGWLMDKHLGKYSNTTQVNEVTRKLRTANKVRSVHKVNAGDAPLRCVTNGVLNTETWELREHSPEYRFTRCLNARWDESVDTSDVTEFLDKITQNDINAKVIAEMFGDTLTKNYTPGWFGMIYGEGANGKSVLFACLRIVLNENVGVESLQDIANTRWSSAMFAGGTGELANINPDIPDDTIENSAPIKNLTSGDSTSHEKKRVNKFKSVNTAKLIFAMNKPAKFDEILKCVRRRIKPIHLPCEFVPAEEVDDDVPLQFERNKDLEEELTTDDNRAAWLQVMAEGLQRLRDNDGFSYERSQRELFDQYQSEADTFWSFQNECLRNERTTYTDSDTPVYLTFNEIHSAYASYCHAHDEKPMKESQFAQELNKIGNLDIEKYHPADADGSNSRKYLVFTDTGFQHAMTSTLKRFATRVDDDDVSVPGMDDTDDSAGQERVDAEATAECVIRRVNRQNASGATYRAIVSHCRENRSDIDDVLDGISYLEEKGDVVEDDDGVFRVVEEDDDGDDTDDGSGTSGDGSDGDSEEREKRVRVAREVLKMSDGTYTGVSCQAVAGRLRDDMDPVTVDEIINSLESDGVLYTVTEDDTDMVGVNPQTKDFVARGGCNE